MKKVLCIEAGPMPGDVPGEPKLIEGKVYTATRIVNGIGLDGWSGSCYELKEINPLFAYLIERFIPLSDGENYSEIKEEKYEQTTRLSPAY